MVQLITNDRVLACVLLECSIRRMVRGGRKGGREGGREGGRGERRYEEQRSNHKRRRGILIGVFNLQTCSSLEYI